MSKEGWDFLEKILTLLIVPAAMWYLNQKQTSKITKQVDAQTETIKENAVVAAQEVKAELAVAKIELQQEAAVVAADVAAKIDAVHETAAETKKIANGDRAAKEAEIRRLRSKMRDKGLDPDND
jgi:hypothetical protein